MISEFIKMDKQWDISPKKIKTTSQSAWRTEQLHAINGAKVVKTIPSLAKVLKKSKAPETKFLTNGYEKGKIVSDIL